VFRWSYTYYQTRLPIFAAAIAPFLAGRPAADDHEIKLI
jgi:hypothetical protein